MGASAATNCNKVSVLQAAGVASYVTIVARFIGHGMSGTASNHPIQIQPWLHITRLLR
jgi:hypothetical protein